MLQRIACTLIGSALALISALVAVLLSDALAPGRLPPMLAFWGACAAGTSLILGLMLLERRGSMRGPAPVDRHVGGAIGFAQRSAG